MKKLMIIILTVISTNSWATTFTCSDGWFFLTGESLENEIIEDIELSNKYGIIAKARHLKDTNYHNDNEPPYWFEIPTHDQEECFAKRTVVIKDNLEELSSRDMFQVNLLCGSSSSQLACSLGETSKLKTSISTGSSFNNKSLCWECTSDGEVCWAVPCN